MFDEGQAKIHKTNKQKTFKGEKRIKGNLVSKQLLTLQSSLAVLQLQHAIVDQSLPQQILSGKNLTALHHHDGLAVCAAVKLLQAASFLVFIHLPINRRNHVLHKPDRLLQVVVVFLTLCVLIYDEGGQTGCSTIARIKGSE